MSRPDPDQLLRFDFEHAAVRGALVHLDASVREVLAQHFYPDAIATLLGEALAATVLLGSSLKFPGRVSLQCKSDGAAAILFAECSDQREVRGYVRVQEEPSGGGFMQLLHNGTLAITITPDQGQHYQGIVPLDADHLAPCLEHYFAQSEQLPTVIVLAADRERAAGFMLQVLPAAGGADGRRGEDWEHLHQLALTLGAAELLAESCETLLYRLFHADAVRVYPPQPVCFACRCSRGRAESTLRSLGEHEVRDILAGHGVISIHCELCQQEYAFDADAVAALFAADEAATEPAATRH